MAETFPLSLISERCEAQATALLDTLGLKSAPIRLRIPWNGTAARDGRKTRQTFAGDLRQARAGGAGQDAAVRPEKVSRTCLLKKSEKYFQLSQAAAFSSERLRLTNSMWVGLQIWYIRRVDLCPGF